MTKFQSLLNVLEYIQGAKQCLQHFIDTDNALEIMRERTNIRNAEKRLALHMINLESELRVEGVPARPIVRVYYERGYKWTVDVDGGDSIESNVNKADAVYIAKQVAAEIGGYLDIQTLTHKEKKAAMNDRWDHARSIGQTALKFK